MATSMWRMNGLCRSMTGVLLLCALLFSSEVMSQDPDASAAPSPTVGASDPADSAATAGPAADSSHTPTAARGESVASSVVGKVVSVSVPDLDLGSDGKDAPATTAVPVIVEKGDESPTVVPDVKCVGKEDIQEQSAVRAEIEKTEDCEATKRILEDTPANWCGSTSCSVNIFQDGKKLMVASSDAKLDTLAEVLKSDKLNSKLGLTNIETPPSSSSSVFVGILVSGLLAAIGIIVGYFKCQRKPDAKGPKLAEEAIPVDQENQGNTLVSVAPLNPPPETQEKPNANGESTEAPKTQTPPPTNGHSATKTADTEL